MSDVAPVEEPAAASPLSDVEAAVAAIRAEAEAAAAEVVRAAEAEEARCAKLNAIKAEVEAAVGPICEAIIAATDEAEKAALRELEAKVFAPFKEALEAAYLEFSGQRAGDSNPAPPGETFLTTDVSVMGAAQA